MSRHMSNTLVILIDTGRRSLDQNSIEDEPFIDKAKFAMKLMIERKIFLQPKDEIALVTINDESSTDDIKLYKPHFFLPNWEVIKYINNLQSTKLEKTNWVEGFETVSNLIKKQENKKAKVNCVIISNLKENYMDDYDAAAIIDEINELKSVLKGFNLLFLTDSPLRESKTSSGQLVKDICKDMIAQSETVDNFIEMRKFHHPIPTNIVGWHSEIHWGGMRFPCSSYVKVSKNTFLKNWKTRVAKENDDKLVNSNASFNTSTSESVETETIAIHKERKYMGKYRDFVEDVAKAYRFGNKYIPTTAEDEKAMKLQGNNKGIEILGFVPQEDIKLEFWSGEAKIIVPKVEYATGFYSLVQAMIQENNVAIIKKITNNNTAPKMGVLFPTTVDDRPWGFVHLELPYADQIRKLRKFQKQSLDSELLSEKKMEAISDFVDSHIFAEEETENFLPGTQPNLWLQYIIKTLSQKALEPDKPITKSIDFLRPYLSKPESIQKKSQDCYKKISQLFHFEPFMIGSKRKPKITQRRKKNTNDATANNGLIPIDIPLDQDFEDDNMDTFISKPKETQDDSQLFKPESIIADDLFDEF